jgi:anti-sigma regulatory factor (Ser/Thr protein kinase)
VEYQEEVHGPNRLTPMSTILRVDIERDRRAPATAREALASLEAKVEAALIPDAKLLASELVTNSVKYGGSGPVTLVATSEDPSELRVEVIDQGVGFVPVARDKPRTDVGGWGLHLVESLSDRWGVHDGSTHVWFELSSGR